MDTNTDILHNIDLVKQTLQGLQITAVYDNLDRLLGCLQMLEKIKADVAILQQNAPEIRISEVGTGGDEVEAEMEEPIAVPVEEIYPAE